MFFAHCLHPAAIPAAPMRQTDFAPESTMPASNTTTGLSQPDLRVLNEVTSPDDQGNPGLVSSYVTHNPHFYL